MNLRHQDHQYWDGQKFNDFCFSPPNSDRPKGGKVTREMMVDAILKGKNMESLEGLEGSSEMSKR